MTVAELIMRLQAVDPTSEVVIVDSGVRSIYAGAYPVRLVDFNDKRVLTIDIDGYRVEET